MPVSTARLSYAIPSFSDSVDLTQHVLGIYVGTGENLKVTLLKDVDGTSVLLKNIPNGTFLDIGVKRIWLTGSTASDVVGFL